MWKVATKGSCHAGDFLVSGLPAMKLFFSPFACLSNPWCFDIAVEKIFPDLGCYSHVLSIMAQNVARAWPNPANPKPIVTTIYRQSGTTNADEYGVRVLVWKILF